MTLFAIPEFLFTFLNYCAPHRVPSTPAILIHLLETAVVFLEGNGGATWRWVFVLVPITVVFQARTSAILRAATCSSVFHFQQSTSLVGSDVEMRPVVDRGVIPVRREWVRVEKYDRIDHPGNQYRRPISSCRASVVVPHKRARPDTYPEKDKSRLPLDSREKAVRLTVRVRVWWRRSSSLEPWEDIR